MQGVKQKQLSVSGKLVHMSLVILIQYATTDVPEESQ